MQDKTNRRVLANLGFLCQIAGLLIILPIFIGFCFNEFESIIPLLITCVSFLGSGFLMNVLAERKELDLKSSCVLILIAFLFLPLIGSIPYIYFNSFNDGDLIKRFTNAYFESVSGYTTTGFSFVSDTDSLPKSFLFYRSLTELIGGVGIVFMLLAFLYPNKSVMSLGEVLGIDDLCDDLKKIFLSVLLIYGIYVVAFSLIFYYFGFQDVIATSSFLIDTITGGYQPSPKQFQRYLFFPIKTFILLIMFVGSVNFSFNYRIFTLKWKKAITKEVLLYLCIIFFGAFLILFLSEKELFDSIFHVVSMSSSTGYDYIDIPKLNDIVRSIFILLMMLGGCGFSMAGGIKLYRLVIFFKSIGIGIKKVLSKETWILYESEELSSTEIISNLLSILLFASIFVIFSVVFSTIGVPIIDALFEIGSALSTNGISMGITTVSMPLFHKWLLILSMIIGRIEILTIFVALSPIQTKQIG